MHKFIASFCIALRHTLLPGVLLLAAVAAQAAEPAGLLRSFPRSQLLLTTENRCTLIDIWVAANNAQRAQGLMQITSLDRYEGMLFVHNEPRILSMWMRNTFIPLDMLFATADGRIVHLHPSAIPHDESIISSVRPASLVVELNAGSIEAMGIRVGHRVEVPAG